MFIDTIEYEDFNGNAQKQEVFFNLSKMEALELEAAYPNGYSEMLSEVAERENMIEILNAFKDIVKLAYGIKSEDGKRFIKSEEAFKEFEESPVYDEFMMKLMTEEDYALDFILGTLPNNEALTKEAVLSDVKLKLGTGSTVGV